jgi:hypothetical protein
VVFWIVSVQGTGSDNRFQQITLLPPLHVQRQVARGTTRSVLQTLAVWLTALLPAIHDPHLHRSARSKNSGNSDRLGEFVEPHECSPRHAVHPNSVAAGHHRVADGLCPARRPGYPSPLHSRQRAPRRRSFVCSVLPSEAAHTRPADPVTAPSGHVVQNDRYRHGKVNRNRKIGGMTSAISVFAVAHWVRTGLSSPPGTASPFWAQTGNFRKFRLPLRWQQHKRRLRWWSCLRVD